MSEQRVNTVRLQRMVRAYRESGALMAAVELGLFTRIARGADTEAALIAALGVEPLNAERIIVACIALGLAWMLFTKPDWDEWGRLAEHLRRLGPPLSENKTVAGITVEEARRYHRATYSIGMGAGRLFLRQVDLTGRRKIMDIGGGSGAYCINACGKYPSLETRFRRTPTSRSWRATCPCTGAKRSRRW
jgi:hypothetical protein